MKTTKPLLALILNLVPSHLKLFFSKLLLLQASYIIDVKSLNNGLYILRIKNNSQETTFIQKIIVQH